MRRVFQYVGLVLAVLIGIYFALLFTVPEKFLPLVQKMERGRAGLVEKSIPVGSHVIRYVETRGTGDHVVLLHGFGGDKDNWVRMAPFLAKRNYHLVIPDLPGWGESTRLADTDYSPHAQVDRLEAIVAALGLETFHLAGNSMGGSIAGLYAAKYPHRVRTLTFYDNAGVPTAVKNEREVLLAQGTNVLLVQKPEDFDRMLEWLFVEKPFIPSPVKRVLAQKAQRDSVANAKIFEQVAAEHSALLPLLPGLKMPVAIVWGDRDRLLDVSVAHVMKQALPTARLHIMANCGHAPQLERPAEAAGYMMALMTGN